jgi:hypothetical protein
MQIVVSAVGFVLNVANHVLYLVRMLRRNMQATLDVEELIFIGACAIYGGMVGAGKEGACAREKSIKESKKIWNDVLEQENK